MSPRKMAGHGRSTTSKGLSRRDVLILGVGAATSSTAFTAKVQAAEEVEHYGLSAFGDLAYPRNFSPSEVCQSGRAKRRRLQSARRRGHRYIQLAQRLHPQGRSSDRHGAGVRLADGASQRRAGCGLWPRGRRGHDFRRPPYLSVQAARGHQASTTAARSRPPMWPFRCRS